MMSKLESIISKHWNIIKFVSLLMSLAAAYFTFDNYINNQIDKQITSTNYIEKLSKILRPFLVFNGDGIILYDHGAANIVKSIDISDNEETINVQFTEFVQHAPLLIVIGVNESTYKPIRGKNYSWIFKNTTKAIYMDLHELPKKEDMKYVIEILK